MKLDLDPQELRECMRLWRDAADMRIPLKDEYKIHVMTQRRKLLTGYERQASAWEMLLRMCKPGPRDAGDFEALVTEVQEFGAWAKQGVQAMDAMSQQERSDDEMDRMLHDPKMAGVIRKLFDEKPGDQSSTE